MKARLQRLIDAEALREELKALHMKLDASRAYPEGWNDAINVAIDSVEDAETVAIQYTPDETEVHEYELEICDD